ncbi:MAG: hypothetical protein HRT35_14285 [Algicola sp.]|nr:hypothetical protein [Algicola sp.]
MTTDKIKTAAHNLYLLNADDIDACIDIVWYGVDERIKCPATKPLIKKLANYIAKQAYGGAIPLSHLSMDQKLSMQKYENLAIEVIPLGELSATTFEKETKATE